MTIQWAYNQSECVLCDDTSIACHHTKSKIQLHPGFFLESSAWQQTTVAPKPVPCPFEPTCVGGSEPGSLCINGSTGPLCGVCAVGFYRDRHSCSLCPESYSSTATTVTLVAFVCLVIVGLLYCYLHSVAVAAIDAAVAREQSSAVGGLSEQDSDVATWPPFVSHVDWPTDRRPFISYAESGARTATLSAPPKIPAAAMRESGDSSSWSALCTSCLGFPSRTGRRLLPASWPRVLGTLVKILLGYTQMLYVFTMLQAVHWPESFESFMHHIDLTMIIGVQAWIDKLLLPYDCIVRNINAYQLLVMTLIMPAGCSALIGLVSMLAWCTTAGRRRPLKEVNGRLNMASALGPGIWHLHVWLMLMLYPSLCREALSIFLCTGVPILSDDGNTTMVHYLNQDTNEQCGGPDGAQWYFFSLIAGTVGILGYALGLPAIALLLTRRYQRSTSRADRAWTGRRISLLLSSYIDECYWFESADLLRKFLLTGVVLNVAPGSNVQIWFGLMVSVAATVLTLKWSPYRDWLCGWVQAAATLQIMFNYMTAIVFYIPRGAPLSINELLSNSIGVVLLIVNSLAFVLLVGALAWGTRSAALKPQAHWKSAHGRPVIAKPPASGAFHAFISHSHLHGQDQAKTIKLALSSVCPSLRCFLDVDDLHSIDELEFYVDRADMILVFLSGSTDVGTGVKRSNYFESRCVGWSQSLYLRAMSSLMHCLTPCLVLSDVPPSQRVPPRV